MSLRRRALGVALLGVATLSWLQPVLVGPTVDAVRLPTLADPGSLVAVAPAAFVAGGTVLFVSGGAAVRDANLPARVGLLVPVGCVAVAVGLAVGAGVDLTAGTPGTLPDPVRFVVAGAAVGGSLAPVTLGATRGDTPVLIAGSVLLLVGLGVAPAPGFALLAGLLGGGGAIGLAWMLDAATWAP